MHSLTVRVGPLSFRLGSPWRAPIDAAAGLYAGYPQPDDGIATVTARIAAPSLLRRFFRPQVLVEGDHRLDGTIPMALRHGLLALEMAMNMQVALGERRYLLLHAAAVERGGRAVILPGESGSGKSTLGALLGEMGWRLLADEFVLIDLSTGLIQPFPRAISLKNESIAAMKAVVSDVSRFGPHLSGTPKGELRHLRPPPDAIARMDEPAEPALILFPTFGPEAAVEGVSRSELFARITEGSTNYSDLGEAGFIRLSQLAQTVPAVRFAYPDGPTGVAIVEQFCAEAGL